MKKGDFTFIKRLRSELEYAIAYFSSQSEKEIVVRLSRAKDELTGILMAETLAKLKAKKGAQA